jgi:hypothetical protein
MWGSVYMGTVMDCTEIAGIIFYGENERVHLRVPLLASCVIYISILLSTIRFLFGSFTLFPHDKALIYQKSFLKPYGMYSMDPLLRYPEVVLAIDYSTGRYSHFHTLFIVD